MSEQAHVPERRGPGRPPLNRQNQQPQATAKEDFTPGKVTGTVTVLDMVGDGAGTFGSTPPPINGQPMDSAPKDGKPVWLTDGKGNKCEGVWRQTRKFGMRTNGYGRLVAMWTDAGVWALTHFGGAKIPFVARGWHR